MTSTPGGSTRTSIFRVFAVDQRFVAGVYQRGASEAVRSLFIFVQITLSPVTYPYNRLSYMVNVQVAYVTLAQRAEHEGS